MHPILTTIGPVTLYSYGLMLAIAFLVASWRATVAARTWPEAPAPIAADRIMNLCTMTIIGGLIGARAFFVLSNWEVFWLFPLEIFAIWHGGLVFYGGMAGGLVAGVWYVRANNLSTLRVLDQMAPFVVLGHAMGRIGCFLNGCCYGKLTTAWFGVEFPGHAHPVIPTQLIESAALFGLFVVLRRLQRPALLHRRGAVFGCYVLAYAVLRFLIEFWRGDQDVLGFGWTLQQFISVALGLAALGWLVLQWRSDGAHVSSRRWAR